MDNLTETYLVMKEATSPDWKGYEKLLKAHDWTYQMSDDYGAYTKGKVQREKINLMYAQLQKVDLKKTNNLYKKYQAAY